MKKFLPLLLAALLAFGLCGCAGSDAPDEPEATQVVEEPDYVPAFSDAESAAMASFMNKTARSSTSPRCIPSILTANTAPCLRGTRPTVSP